MGKRFLPQHSKFYESATFEEMFEHGYNIEYESLKPMLTHFLKPVKQWRCNAFLAGVVMRIVDDHNKNE